MGTTKFLVYALLFAQGQAPAFKVIPGIKHSSITLSTSFDPRSVKEVTWNQKTPKAQWQVAKNGHMTSVLNERFSQTHNGTRLVINNLTETDNGVYRAEATLEDGTMNQEYFNVTVYDPVPQPQIIPHVKRIGDQYNVTLQCSVPSNTSDLSYTWTYRLRGSENWSTENDTSSIQMMLPPDQNMEFVCTVYNPADQKNVSFYCEQCSEGMTERSRIRIIVFGVVLLLGIIIAFGIYFVKQKLNKFSSNTSRQGASEATAVSYHQVPLTLKPEPEAFKAPVQETKPEAFKAPVQETKSTTSETPCEKNGMKNKESDEEGIELKNKPSWNPSSVRRF